MKRWLVTVGIDVTICGEINAVQEDFKP